MLAKMFVPENNRGCKLSSGRKVPNHWYELSNDCQEECFCLNNEFYCQSKLCDLIENQCVIDSFGKNFCFPKNSFSSLETECKNFTYPETTTAASTTTTFTSAITQNTTITTEINTAPNTTIAINTSIESNTTVTPIAEPYITIDEIIDINADQEVGTIDKYYVDFEMSFEVKVNGNLTSDYASSIKGFFE